LKSGDAMYPATFDPVHTNIVHLSPGFFEKSKQILLIFNTRYIYM
jgi:hypothetical protein